MCKFCPYGAFTVKRSALDHVNRHHQADESVNQPLLRQWWVPIDTSEHDEDVQKDGIIDLKHEEDNGGAVNTSSEAVRPVMRTGEEARAADQASGIGDWIAQFVGAQLDCAARSLATAPAAGAGRAAASLLTLAQREQLADKTQQLCDFLRQTGHEHEKQQRSDPSVRPSSVHWADDVPLSSTKCPPANEQCRPLLCDHILLSPISTLLDHSNEAAGSSAMTMTAFSRSEPGFSRESVFRLLAHQKTWPLLPLSTEFDDADYGNQLYYTSEDESTPSMTDPKTGEPLQARHIPPSQQHIYLARLEDCCISAAYTFYHKHRAELDTVKDRRGNRLCKTSTQPHITHPSDLSLPQWTHLLRRLSDAKGLKREMVSRIESFNGEIQPVDEVRHACSKRKWKSDRDLLALVQVTRTFCWQLRDWERCRDLDRFYEVVEQYIAVEKRRRREEERRRPKSVKTWSGEEIERRRASTDAGRPADSDG